jgi:hypothetical protein
MAFKRITEEELQNTALSTPSFVGTVLHESRRGWEFSQIYWVEVLETPKIGEFYSYRELPKNLIASQRKFIKQAVLNFENAQRE